MIDKKTFCKMQDHSILEPQATREQVEKHCQDTLDYELGTAYVCPNYVSLAKSILKDKALVGTVIGFPSGGQTTDIKVAEALDAVENGADKIDVVINISRLKSGESEYCANELRRIVQAVRAVKADTIIKVIIETCFLTHDEKVEACEIVSDSGVDYIKTSTGTGPAGCRIGDIRLMKRVCGDRVKIKAAAQITTIEDALAVIEEGASAIGENTALKMLSEWDKQLWHK